MQKILVVDDSRMNLKILSDFLKDQYEVFAADNGNKAVQVAEEVLPDLILMDVIMPEIDGFTACSILKSNLKTVEIPVIFITAQNNTEDIVRGFNVGGVDYITKPFNPLELNVRVKTHIELKKYQEELKNYVQRMEELNKEINHKNVQLNEAYNDIRNAAMTDPLTGLANRRYMIEKTKEETARFMRSEKIFSFILGDIDYFKKINDQFGHECGDYVLKAVSKFMRSKIREQDIISRWGGEEFLLLLPETNLNGALVVAEKLRSGIEDLEMVYKGKRIAATMTFGVAAFGKEDSVDDTIKRADDALYIGKSKGRNCIFNL